MGCSTVPHAGQAGIPWTRVGSYRSTNWQGFDIAPGNGRLDPGDVVVLKVFVSNCQPGAADHTAQVYMDVFGSKMPGLSVAASGPSTTKPGEQVTYTYNYVNNSGVYALGATVRVVSAFHNVTAHKLATDEDIACDVLVFGDDKADRAQVVVLANAVGLRGMHGGALANSAAISPASQLSTSKAASSSIAWLAAGLA